MSTTKGVMPSAADRRKLQAEFDSAADRTFAHEMTYDAHANAFRFLMRTGATVIVPVACIEELAGAPRTEIAKVKLVTGGGALEHRGLDVDIWLPGLIRQAVGLELQQSRAAKVKTPARAAAARANGAKGGRPRKVAEPAS